MFGGACCWGSLRRAAEGCAPPTAFPTSSMSISTLLLHVIHPNLFLLHALRRTPAEAASSPPYPAILRRVLPYQAAGGSSSTGQCSVLDVEVRTPADRSKICLGSSQLVEDSLPAMQAA